MMRQGYFSLLLLPLLAFALPCHADDERSIEELQEAATKGDADAQFQLGHAYQMGEGVKQNDTMGASWMLKAANQGNVEAQYNLGMVYRGGYGVPQDSITAYMWAELAVANGSSKAFDLRRDLSMSMTLDQINEAKYRATHWKPDSE